MAVGGQEADREAAAIEERQVPTYLLTIGRYLGT